MKGGKARGGGLGKSGRWKLGYWGISIFYLRSSIFFLVASGGQERIQVAVDPGESVGLGDGDDGLRPRIPEGNDFMAGFERRLEKMRTDKACGAGEKNPHEEKVESGKLK